MPLGQHHTINLPPNDELGGCDDSTNQIRKKSEFILLCWSQDPWAWTWDILFFWVFGHTGHVPAPNRL